jgi:hypothetical protein
VQLQYQKVALLLQRMWYCVRKLMVEAKEVLGHLSMQSKQQRQTTLRAEWLEERDRWAAWRTTSQKVIPN